MPDFVPILYVLVRPLDSMNPGKAQAHSGHAASAFCKHAWKNQESVGSYKDWLHCTPQGFGTQINLAVKNDEQYLNTVQILSSVVYEVSGMPGSRRYSHANIFCETIKDPTYPYIVTDEIYHIIPDKIHSIPATPLKDGSWRCYREEETAYYVFVGEHNEKIISAIKANTVLAP